MKMIKELFKYLFYTFLVFLVGLCCYVFVTLDIMHKDYVNVFGYTYFVIASGSMSGEIEVNDIVFVKITNDVETNDIIAFKDGKSIITHRLIQKDKNKYITKGDANEALDNPITKDDIIGKIIYIVSPKFILEFVVLLFIIFIVLALLNFDGFFKKLFGSKEEPEINRNYTNVLPQDIFCSPKDRENYNEHSGLTITIPIGELQSIKEQLKKKEIEVLEIDDEVIEPVKDLSEIYNTIETVLKVRNSKREKTRLTKKWQEKYLYVYKLGLILQNGQYDKLDEEIKNPPFKELFDYDIEEIGLYKELRNQIYVLPIYAFLKILLQAVVYNDEELFDGIYKILKYKILVDRNNLFIVVKERNDKKSLREIIDFMEEVAKNYKGEDKLDLDRVKNLIKISNY